MRLVWASMQRHAAGSLAVCSLAAGLAACGTPANRAAETPAPPLASAAMGTDHEPLPTPSAPPAVDVQAGAAALAATAKAKALSQARADAEAEAAESRLQRLRRLLHRRRAAPAPVAPAPPVVSTPAPAVTVHPLIVIRQLSREQARGLFDGEVRRPDGKVIGRAVDMLVDTDGTPRQILINLAGFMGIGDRKVAFGWSDFRFDPAAGDAPLTLLTNSAGMPSTEVNKPVTPAGAKPGTAAVAPWLQLSDASVERPEANKVGRVVDVLLDAQTHPQAVVMDVGDSLIPGTHKIAVLWSALRFQKQSAGILLKTDLTDAQIQAAPAYATDKPVEAVGPLPVVAPGALAAPAAALLAAPGPRALAISPSRQH
ncbi:MAG: PRC-barrel domain containing protein [Janthinobacterium lividum]